VCGLRPDRQHVGTTTIHKESSTIIIEPYEGTKQSKIMLSATVDWPTVDPIAESGRTVEPNHKAKQGIGVFFLVNLIRHSFSKLLMWVTKPSLNFVRKVISPERSPDRFPDPRRALIGGACRL
jgi:hypothetical protein